MKTGTKGIELIKHFEGCELEAYKCAAGVWTIGYGTTAYSFNDDDEWEDLIYSAPISEAKAE